MEYKFGGIITLEDYIQFNKKANKSFFSKKFNIIFYLIIIVICAYFIVPALLSAIFSMAKLEYSELIILFKQPRFIINICILLSIPFLIKLLNIIFDKIMKQLYKKVYNSNKIMTEYENYIITENMINIFKENENINITKNKIFKIEMDNNSIYIYIGLNIAYIIKSHFFKDENIFNELKIFIKDNYM